jgi:hypothetical protein
VAKQMDNQGSVILIRKTRWFGLLRSLAVFLDGEKTEAIDEDSTIELTLSPGSHEIYVKMDWARSNKFQFNISAREKVYLVCQTRLGGWKYLFMFFYVIFFFNKIFVVEQITPVQFEEVSKIRYHAGWGRTIVTVFVTILVLALIYIFVSLEFGF